MEPESMAVDVYSFEFLKGIEGDGYLWDFGLFKCFGSEEHPTSSFDDIQVYQGIFSGVDLDAFDEAVPERTDVVSVYEFDYTLLVETTLESATHLVAPDGVPWELDRGVTVTGEAGVVMTSTERHQREKEAVTREDLQALVDHEGWVPVFRVVN